MLRRLRAALLAALLITTCTATVATSATAAETGAAAVQATFFELQPVAWTKVHSSHQNQAYWNGQNDGPEPKLGYCPWEFGCPFRAENGTKIFGDYRSYFQYDVSPLRGKAILQASVVGFLDKSASCTPSDLQLIATGPISPQTTWANQPQFFGTLDQRQTNQGGGPNCPAGWLELNAIQGVQNAVHGSGILTTLLKASGEHTTNSYKRFQKPPTLRIAYNTAPNAPSDMQVDDQPCGLVPTEPHNSTGEFPELSFVLTDPDHDQLRARIEVSTWDGRPLGTREVLGWSGTRFTVQWDLVESGQTYSWKVTSLTDGIEPGPSSGRCDFTVD